MSTGGILKGGVSTRYWGFEGGAQPPHRLYNLEIQWPRPCNLVGSWDISFAVKPDIVSVAGHNMQWGRYVCLSCSQKRENTAFELVLRSASSWHSNSGKQVARSSTPCQKRSQGWGTKSELWSKYMQQSRQCWKREEFCKTSSFC